MGKDTGQGAEWEREAIGGDLPKQIIYESTLMKPIGLYANF